LTGEQNIHFSWQGGKRSERPVIIPYFFALDEKAVMSCNVPFIHHSQTGGEKSSWSDIGYIILKELVLLYTNQTQTWGKVKN